MTTAETILEIIALKNEGKSLSQKAAVKLYNICYKLYEHKGQHAVIDFCKKIGWKNWKKCRFCEIKSPVNTWEDGKDYTCMVCGISKINV